MVLFRGRRRSQQQRQPRRGLFGGRSARQRQEVSPASQQIKQPSINIVGADKGDGYGQALSVNRTDGKELRRNPNTGQTKLVQPASPPSSAKMLEDASRKAMGAASSVPMGAVSSSAAGGSLVPPSIMASSNPRGSSTFRPPAPPKPISQPAAPKPISQGGNLSLGRSMTGGSNPLPGKQDIDDFIKSEAAAQGVSPQPSAPQAAPQQRAGTGVFGYQKYRSSNGNFTQDAVVMGIRDGSAVMQKPNGVTINVPLDKLDGPSRERAIAASSARGMVRGTDADRMPVSSADSMNRMFGSRDRNELYRSTTGRMTAGDPDGYTRQQAFNSAMSVAPPVPTTAMGNLRSREIAARAGTGSPLSAAEQSQLSEDRARRFAQANGLPYIPPGNNTSRGASSPGGGGSRDFVAPRGSAYYRSDDPRGTGARRQAKPLDDVDPGNEIDLGGGLKTVSGFTRRTQGDGTPVTMGPTIELDDGLMTVKGSVRSPSEGGGRTVVMQPTGQSGTLGSTRYAQLDARGNVVGTRAGLTTRGRQEMEAMGLDPTSAEDLQAYRVSQFKESRERKAAREKRADEIRELAGGTGPGMGARTQSARQELARRRLDEQREDELAQSQFERDKELLQIESQNNSRASFDQRLKLLEQMPDGPEKQMMIATLSRQMEGQDIGNDKQADTPQGREVIRQEKAERDARLGEIKSDQDLASNQISELRNPPQGISVSQQVQDFGPDIALELTLSSGTEEDYMDIINVIRNDDLMDDDFLAQQIIDSNTSTVRKRRALAPFVESGNEIAAEYIDEENSKMRNPLMGTPDAMRANMFGG